MKTTKIIIGLALSVLCLAVVFAPCSANAGKWSSSIDPLAEAVPNECYAGMGVDYPGGITPGDGWMTPVDCSEYPNPYGNDVYPKTNDSYVWALTDVGGRGKPQAIALVGEGPDIGIIGFRD